MRRHRSLSAIIVAGLVLASSTVAGAAQTTPSVRLDLFDKTVLVQINSVRQAHALNPLQRSTSLAAAADRHTREMGEAGYFAHSSLDRTLFWKRIAQSYGLTGYHHWSVGENLLFLAPDVSAPEAIRMWMNSPEHRANLLDPRWRDVGISARHYTAASGIYRGGEVTIVTADFGVRR